MSEGSRDLAVVVGAVGRALGAICGESSDQTDPFSALVDEIALERRSLSQVQTPDQRMGQLSLARIMRGKGYTRDRLSGMTKQEITSVISGDVAAALGAAIHEAFHPPEAQAGGVGGSPSMAGGAPEATTPVPRYSTPAPKKTKPKKKKKKKTAWVPPRMNLRVQCFSGKGLKDTAFIGSMDPFVRIKLGELSRDSAVAVGGGTSPNVSHAAERYAAAERQR